MRSLELIPDSGTRREPPAGARSFSSPGLAHAGSVADDVPGSPISRPPKPPLRHFAHSALHVT